MPDHQLLGTNVGGKYEWLSFKQVDDLARDFAAGAMALDLAPEVEGEGRQWRFLGIQSNLNRNSNISHICITAFK